MVKLVVLVALVAVVANGLPVAEKLRGHKIVEQINSMDTTFTARHYPEFDGLSVEELRRIAGNSAKRPKKPRFSINTRQNSQHDSLAADLPSRFDVAEHWPECKDVYTIQVQGNCSSSAAIAVATATRDRRCIRNDKDESLSAYDLLACAAEQNSEDDVCVNGLSHDEAFQYFISDGVVTGGAFQSHEGCIPYPIPAKLSVPWKTKVKCTAKCTPPSLRDYTKDKVKISSSKTFSYANNDIMREILARGPVVAELDLYEDFLSYNGGVYKHVTGKHIGSYYAKITGWGVNEVGVSYWKAVSSNMQNWGELGTFKVIRGGNSNDNANFESNVIAGNI